jgi:hypothetical protein
MSDKPVVHFSAVHSDIRIGWNAMITPCDHPSQFVTNTGAALTSPVTAIMEDGGFETLNTIYKPIPNEEE